MNRRARRKASHVVIFALALVVRPETGAAQNPAAPPGTDPGGPAIALISTGVDYTDPMIAPRLARDGEGEPIAWDFVDNDLRPHAPINADSGNGTKLAKLILSLNDKVRLINVRVSRKEPDQLAKAAMFVARTPARVAVVGTYPEDAAGWEQFGGAARGAAANLLFTVPGGPLPAEVRGSPYPVQLNLQNTVVAAPFLDNPGTSPGGDVNLPIDAQIKQRETKGGEQVTVVPIDGLEAAALLGGYAVCVIEGKNIEDAAAARAILQEQAIADAAAKNVYDPNCAQTNGGDRPPAGVQPLGSGEQ